MASFMKQMSNLIPLPRPTQETNQNIPDPPIPSLIMNLSYPNVSVIHFQASKDNSLAGGEMSRSVEK